MKKSNPYFENESIRCCFCSEFFAVGAASFLGAFIRIQLRDRIEIDNEEKSIIFGCMNNTNPFLDIFSKQTFLLPNLVGCFVMGLCLVNRDKINETSSSLYKALTTGLCGCITTFSSWMNNAVEISFTRSSWFNVILMIFIEFLITWGSFSSGFIVGKFINEGLSYYFYSALEGGSRHHLRNEENEIQLLENSCSNKGEVDMINYSEGLSVVSSGAREFIDLRIFDNYSTLETSVKEKSPPSQADHDNSVESIIKEEPHLVPDAVLSYEYYIWVGAFAIATVIVLAVIIFGSSAESVNLKTLKRSLIFAPFGAWTRWSLSRISSIKALWPEINPQTLIANLTATTFMCLLINLYDGIWMNAINDGFNGSLSTVSTLFAELNELYLERGSFFSLRYGFITFCTSIIIIQIILSIVSI